MTNLFDPPQVFDLPVSKDGDLYFRLRHSMLVVDDDGDPILVGGKRQYEVTDYPAGATLRAVIETATDPVVVEAVVDGPFATFWETSTEVTNALKDGKRWRAVITYANGLDRVMCNGLVKRWDGEIPK